MISSPKSRKRKVTKPPQPQKDAKARPPTKMIEVQEADDSSEYGYLVEQFLSGSSSTSDHPSSSTSSDRREESVPVGILSPSPISLPQVSPYAFTSSPPLVPSSEEEELSIYDYDGWESPAANLFPEPTHPDLHPYYNFRMNNPPLLSNPSSSFHPLLYPDFSNSRINNPPLLSNPRSNFHPYLSTVLSYPLPPIFKNPLPALHYSPKFPRSN